MNVWVRIWGFMDVDGDTSTETHLSLTAGVHLTVYATKEYAKKAQQQAGGIILEVDAASLADVEGEFGKDILLTDETRGEKSQSSVAYISVCYNGLPFINVPNYGAYEPGTVEPQGEIAEFGPEAEAWFEKLEKETGFELHQ